MDKTISFNILFCHKWFAVQFETDSIERNRLQEVEYDGFKLDTAELRITHPGLYANIKNRMTSEAKKYWAVNEQIEEVPTHAYQTKSVLQ